MITPIRTLTINDICERRDDLLVSTEDIKSVAQNERNEIYEIIVKRCRELRELSFKEKHDHQAYMTLKIRWQELQRLLEELGYELKDDEFDLEDYLRGAKC
jgi:hypothetical protein